MCWSLPVPSFPFKTVYKPATDMCNFCSQNGQSCSVQGDCCGYPTISQCIGGFCQPW